MAPTEVYSYAAPKAGNLAFADAYSNAVQANYRVYNIPDIVPQLPFETLGFVQEGPGIPLNSHDYPAIGHSLKDYHRIKTYLYMLNRQITP